MIIYNSSNKIDFSVVGKAKIFTIDNPRFIPRYDAYICSVVSLSTVYDGSISPSGEILEVVQYSHLLPYKELVLQKTNKNKLFLIKLREITLG